MGIITREEYIERLRSQRPVVHMNGERVESLVDHEVSQVVINSMAITYDTANDPQYRDLAVVESPLIGEPISRWTHIQQSMEDALAKTQLMRALGDTLCACHYRCITTDCLNTAWAISYEIDQKYGTEYHQRVVEVVKEAQRKDFLLGGGIVDPKGDRMLRPSEQSDPDLYLHVVERRKDGIVVRGAKAHSTGTPFTNIVCVFPCTPLRENEADYAVAFFTPVDAPGISFICRQPPMPEEPKELECPISSRFGQMESFMVFDDVFVPWERVFMCGEYEFALRMLSIFNPFHIWHKCGCRTASMDFSIGALALVADYNGTQNAPHIQDYLTEMIMNAEIVYSCALACAIQGSQHDSGIYVPWRLPGNVGKTYAARKLGEDRFYMQEAAGGLVGTMASEKDYRNPETGKYMEKYLRGREGSSTEERIRAIKLIEDLTATKWAGWYHAMCISGGATPQLLKWRVFGDFDLDRVKQRAMRAAGIRGD